MKLRKFFTLLISLALCNTPLNLKAQDLQGTYELASLEVERGNIHHAVSLYQRVLFFDSHKVYSFDAAQNLASCYATLNDAEKARQYLRMAYNLTQDNASRADLLLKLATTYLLDKQYNYALVELFAIKGGNADISKRKSLYIGMSYFQGGNYVKAHENLKQLVMHDEKAIEALEAAFTHIEKIKRKHNPRRAKGLSMVIPGSGQLISGDYRGAANSFVLTGALMTLFATTTINYSMVDALVSVMPWLQRYYQGGYENAGRAALKRQEEKVARQYHTILRIIEEASDNP